MSGAIVPLFQYLEHEVIADIARRIKKTMTYTRTAELMAMDMQKMGFSPVKIRAEAMKLLNADADYQRVVENNTLEYKKSVKELITGIVDKAAREGNEIVANAGEMSWIDDMRVWESAGKELTDKSFLPTMQRAFARQTKDTIKNLTRTTGFKTMSGYEAVQDAYRRELDKAMIKLCTGTFSQEKVINDVIHNLAQSGLRSIDFASGYSMQLDTAVKLAIRTGCNQIAAKTQDENIMNTGENLVYVSEHWGARNTGDGVANHEWWQGKVYFIKDGTNYSKEAHRIGQDRIMSLWYATGYSVDGSRENNPLGLHGYNCRHQHYVWFEGISSLPAKSPEPAPVIINGKTYDYYAMTQKMRAMERNIRALKREKQAQEKLGVDSTQTNAKLRQKRREYKEFCEKCNVPERTVNLRVDSGSSDLTRTKAYRKYQEEYFNSSLRSKTLGASDAVGDGKEPICIGQIDPAKTKEAVRHYCEQIRDSEIEELFVIDKKGNVYYNSGQEDFVGFGTLDLTECTILHNHPKSNGIVSFGENDFKAIRDNGVSEWYLVNEKYSYYAKKLKSMDELAYNPYYLRALSRVAETDDFQHSVFEILKEEGYIIYERRAL